MTIVRFANVPDSQNRIKPVEETEDRNLLSQQRFLEMLAYERKRSERSKRPFLLMLIEASDTHQDRQNGVELFQIMAALASKTRETDILGWYREQTSVGVIFTELIEDDRNAILGTLLSRFSATLQSDEPVNPLHRITISFHFFPDDWKEEDAGGGSSDPVLYPDIHAPVKGKLFDLTVKRVMDIAISSLTLAICLPIFLVIAAAIKATSRGPVFFRQQRVGQYGRHFTFLKFRSMRVNNDCSIHREYVSRLIAGTAARVTAIGESDGVYKLANDRRVTRVGRFLRRTSLDELPQLINVLRGEMSLVGPRPPIPYELAAYETWHRQRLLQVKPGITGLWQVKGRSRVSFDDMVRLDLQYASTWSPWMDFIILLQTPGAVFKGAY